MGIGKGKQTEKGGLGKQLVKMIHPRNGRVGRKRDMEKGDARRRWKKGRCKRLMRTSEKLILTSPWDGRLRKIREMEFG